MKHEHLQNRDTAAAILTGPQIDRGKLERIRQEEIAPLDRNSSALVQKIARQHGGEARYVSKYENGACFEVKLAK